MKKILLAYVLVTLVVMAALVVLSYGYGSGYLYVHWRDYHVETTLWFFIAAVLLISLVIQLIWTFIAKRHQFSKRKNKALVEFQELHPYEQLGMVWLLDAAQVQKGFIENKFQQSALLKDVIQARLSTFSGDFETALKDLNQSPPVVFELAELQKIEIYLLQEDIEKAYTHLVFLSQHHFSPWLIDLEQAYQQRLKLLWGRFSSIAPWRYLNHAEQITLLEKDYSQWLMVLFNKFERADEANIQQLNDYYLSQKADILQLDYSLQFLWLKLLNKTMPEQVVVEELASALLSQRLNRDVLHIWLNWQFNCANVDLEKIQHYINQLQQRYGWVPALIFAQCAIYSAQGQTELMQQMFEQYPEQLEFFRIKHALKHDQVLLDALYKLVDEDFKDLKIV